MKVRVRLVPAAVHFTADLTEVTGGTATISLCGVLDDAATPALTEQLEAASQKLGVALALRPLVDADIASGRLAAPFEFEVRPQSAYYLVCPEVIADRPAVATFRKWLLEQAKTST